MTKKELIVACQNLLKEYNQMAEYPLTGIDIDFDIGKYLGLEFSIMPYKIEQKINNKYISIDVEKIEN